uniref:GntR family transcriptional regulator n=1 Tax=Saccharothrix espanaensis TaxID=103731 RepID=UPI003F4985B4
MAMEKRPSAQAIAHHLRTEIESGRLAHREPLPPSAELAAQWGTSAATISRAMTILVNDGLIVSKPRAGRIVNYPIHKPGPSEPSQPSVLLIGGYAGSGKTELGRILARRTHWPMLDKDSTTRPVVEAALTSVGLSPHDRDSETYRTVIRPAEYEALMMGMEENLECGTSCLVTAPFILEFGDPAWCERIRSLIASHGAKTHFVWVACDSATMHRYVRKRGAARDASKLADWPKWISSINLNFRPSTAHHTINNSADAAPLQLQADNLLAELVKS